MFTTVDCSPICHRVYGISGSHTSEKPVCSDVCEKSVFSLAKDRSPYARFGCCNYNNNIDKCASVL